MYNTSSENYYQNLYSTNYYNYPFNAVSIYGVHYIKDAFVNPYFQLTEEVMNDPIRGCNTMANQQIYESYNPNNYSLYSQPIHPTWNFPFSGKANFNSPVFPYPPLIASDEFFQFIDNRSYVNIIPYRYMISNYGRAWDAFKGDFLNQSVRNTQNDKLYNTNGSLTGYMLINISFFPESDSSTTRRRSILVSRAVLLTFGYYLGCENLEANHDNGLHQDNRLCNLTWMTSAENKRHARENGLLVAGELAPKAVITDDLADRAGYLMSIGKTNIEVSQILGIEADIISNIRCGVAYGAVAKKYSLEPSDIHDRITNNDVIDVCERLARGEQPSKIARLKEMTESAVRDIYSRRSHTDISKNYVFPNFEAKYGLHYYNGGEKIFNVTPELVTKICELLQEGKPFKEIAEETDTTERFVKGVRDGRYPAISCNYNFPSYSRYLNPEIVKAICNAMTLNYTNEEIANIFNIELYQVYKIRNGRNYKEISKDYSIPTDLSASQFKQQIVDMYNSGLTPTAICKEINNLYDKRSIIRVLRDEGVDNPLFKN